jgi:hypothetical protein
MYRFSDNSPEAQKWRVEQMDANNAIEGVDKDEEKAALMEAWELEGLSEDEQIERMLEHFASRSTAASSFAR